MITNFPYSIIDLTYSLNINVPSWDRSCGFESKINLDYDECGTKTKFRVQQISMHAGIGTHIDSSSHCINGDATVEDINLAELIKPCICIDVSKKAKTEFSLSVEDILEFEKKNILIPESSFIIIFTGWDRFLHTPEKYHNAYRFPSVSEQAAEFLIERNIVGLGIDTLSPDLPADNFPVHKKILGSGKYIVENIANAQSLPSYGSFILVMPIKAKNLTEAPIRLVGLINPRAKY